MSFLTMLYQLLIGPLELFFETVFCLADHVLANPALSIVALSLAMNILVLPLYRRADAMQEEQRRTEQRLKPWADHIRKNFSGDERFMMLQTYYRQNGYKQTDALKGSVSLLLEVPFFIAAYRFLSGLAVLQGVRFGPIADLGQPDALLALGGLRVNLLPLLMTAINLISAAIYLKGFPLKSKLQMVGMALVFLVLLYQSPAGLVLYWTLNNVFSLVKNIFYKLKNPGGVLRVLAALCGAAGLVFVLFVHPLGTLRRQLMAVALMLVLMLPLILHLLPWRLRLPAPPPEDRRLFTFSSLFLALLTGLLIPSVLIGSSPDEFVFVGRYLSPFWYIVSSMLLAAGTFLIWLRIFYGLANEKGKSLMCMGMLALAVMGALDYLFFSDYGNMSNLLQYEVIPELRLSQILVNLLVLAAACAVFLLLWRKKPVLVRTMLAAAVAAVLGMSVMSMAKIPPKLKNPALKAESSTRQEDWPKFTLSRDGNNVVVLMMDRALGYYLPYLFTERPQLQEQFAGFTYYPNTLSYGSSTREGAPALFGGYEYVPEEISRRTDQSLIEKHNEALLMMPVLFDGAGYRVTVLDPPFANYNWFPDVSIYDAYPSITAISMGGRIDGSELTGELAAQYSEGYFGWQERSEKALLRNLFCHGLFRAAPLLVQPTLYNLGYYNCAAGLAETDDSIPFGQTHSSLSTAKGRYASFVSSYEWLPLMAQLTRLEEGIPGAFVMITNNTAHDACLLQTPDYLPAATVDNRDYDAAHTPRQGPEGWEPLSLTTYRQVSHYHANMAAMIQLGRWMDWLREQGVYDNTRIIIVADHGTHLALSEEMLFGQEQWEDITRFNPLLMVKDFGSSEFSVDWSFMTNADVPLMAVEGLVEEARNPFTGKVLSDEYKYLPVHQVMFSSETNNISGEESVIPEAYWYALRGDQVFDREAWTFEGLH